MRGVIDRGIPQRSASRRLRDAAGPRPVPGRAKGWSGPARLDAMEVSAWFGDAKVLDDVSLSVPPATVTALIGPSGCGKSTFLRILNRMHESVPGAQLAGEVLLNGEDIYAAGHRLTDVRKQIGMVFQKPNPFPAMSIADNVTAGLALTNTKVGKSDRADLIEECLSRAGLWNEVKDRLGPTRIGALRRSAAATVHRPGPGGRAQGAAHGRAVLRPRPDLDPPDRGDHRRARIAGDDRHRHPQHAAGGTGVPAGGLLPGRAGHPRAASSNRAPPTTSSSTRSDPRTADYVNGRFG